MSAGVFQPSRLSREEYRKQKEEDAARRAGEAVPLKDENGNEMNPHIPSFITKAPWYADTGAPSLAHQRLQEDSTAAPHLKLNEWYDRGAKAGPAAKKYRKGACENCGAMSHKKQDCVERPRKKGAKFTGKDIMADEVLQSFNGDYDAKRDRWNGYDPASYKAVVDEYEAIEAARQKVREAQIDAQTSSDMEAVKTVAKKAVGDDEDFGSSDEEDADEDKYAESADQVGQKLDTKTRVTVRNLRIREDTAKYLINLDPESAHYDPKTRAMRDAPEVGVKPEDMRFAGDNFLRYSGDATNMQKLQLFAWQSAQRGNNVNMSSNPTAGEMLMKEFNKKKELLKDTTKTSILAKYGGEEHLEKLPRELLLGQNDDYVEYSRTGNIIKGREKAKARSKYDEDVLLNNHTSVWGSFYDRGTGQWGFACCHSLIAASYCTGEAGKNARHASSADVLLEQSRQSPPPEEESPVRKTLAEEHREKMAKERNATSTSKGKEKDLPNYAKRGDPTEDVDIDRERLRKALAEEKKRKAMNEDEAWQQTKKSKTDVTQEELEAYRLSRQAFEDPMANYKDEEDE